jgi:hypothetical protein
MYFNDFHGKTCRQILDELSNAGVGYFYDAGATLSFWEYGAWYDTSIAPANRTEYSMKDSATITGIYASYGLDPNQEYVSLSSTAGSRIDVSGRYMSPTNAADMASLILTGAGGAVRIWYEWSVSSAIVQNLIQLCNAITYEGKRLFIRSARYRFGADIIAEFSAPAAPIGEYKSKAERQIGYCLRRDENNGGVQITRECGLVLVPTIETE